MVHYHMLDMKNIVALCGDTWAGVFLEDKGQITVAKPTNLSSNRNLISVVQ